MNKNLPLIAQAAVACEAATGLPGSVVAAQCILESGWLEHAPENNCFGIKNYLGSHGRQLLKTDEWFTPAELAYFLKLGDGRTAVLHSPGQQRWTPTGLRTHYIVQDWFATFATLADCFTKHAQIFTLPRYASFSAAYRINHDVVAFVNAIAPIYASAPNYAAEILHILSQPDVAAALAAVKR